MLTENIFMQIPGFLPNLAQSAVKSKPEIQKKLQEVSDRKPSADLIRERTLKNVYSFHLSTQYCLLGDSSRKKLRMRALHSKLRNYVLVSGVSYGFSLGMET